MLFIITVLLAYLAKENFGYVINTNGATAGNLIGLLLPAGFYLKCVYEMKKEGVRGKNQQFLVIMACIMLTVGLASGVIGLATLSPNAGG